MAILSQKLPNLAKNIPVPKKHHINRGLKMIFWFTIGAIIGFLFFVSSLYLLYRNKNENRVYAGVMIDNIEFGGKTKDEVEKYFEDRNKIIQDTTFFIASDEAIATISAKQIGFGYDKELLATQAMSIGKSGNLLPDMRLALQAYITGINLPTAIKYEEKMLDEMITPFATKFNVNPIEGIFNFQNGRVTAFKLSKNGQEVDVQKLKKEIVTKMSEVGKNGKAKTFKLPVPVRVLEPKVSTEKINNYGIRELIARGTSSFAGSIENRAYNINLAASRINGALIAPGEVFSFNQTVGDISGLTGYKQAYVISGGKTILGDGGGVCQVSTTLFRAALNAGLPIVERNQHAYRVGYYEQDRGPGVDAAIYTPSVDLKFKNDTNKHILVQAYPDMINYTLTFELYGTHDNREVIINEPVILSTSPAPEAEYIDDPELPKGEIKQIDFAAAGANVYFTRIVKRNGEIIQDNKFSSNFRPWKAVYLRGTKE